MDILEFYDVYYSEMPRSISLSTTQETPTREVKEDEMIQHSLRDIIKAFETWDEFVVEVSKRGDVVLEVGVLEIFRMGREVERLLETMGFWRELLMFGMTEEKEVYVKEGVREALRQAENMGGRGFLEDILE